MNIRVARADIGIEQSMPFLLYETQDCENEILYCVIAIKPVAISRAMCYNICILFIQVGALCL